MTAYYNEFDPFAAQWLRNLIAAGHIAPGDVDERSIKDVSVADLIGYEQCHFFAGIGGWSLAARIAGWPDDRPLWTGSCPCQPFSVAGKGAGQDDSRHLWPDFFRLIRAARPDVVMGEQVAAAVGKDWLDGVFADLEGIGYVGGASVVPACAVNAPHRRDRLWFVASTRAMGDSQRAGLEGLAGHVHGAGGRPIEDRPVAAASGCGDVEYAPRVGRGEGRPEPEFRSGRTAAAGAGISDCDVADGLRSTGRQDSGSPSCNEIADGRARRHACEQNGDHGPTGDVQGDGDVADGSGERSPNRDAGTVSGRTVAERQAIELERCSGAAWDGAGWLIGHDGKARRVEPGIRLLAHGFSTSLDRMRAIECEATQEVIRYGLSNKVDADEALRMVWQTVRAQESRPEQRAGMLQQLHAPEVLLPIMLCVRAACTASADRSGVAKACDAIRGEMLRSLRSFGKPCRTPREWESDAERPDQSSNALLALSLVLARHAAAYWEAAREADAASDRVGKLRAGGNAIVPQVAAEVIAAWMEVCP